ncbi:hypothetical protein L2E82_51740 [Cichorium intybus]|nr:hypothetical protein L2E82_51740 [Cichorium intybus]
MDGTSYQTTQAPILVDPLLLEVEGGSTSGDFIETRRSHRFWFSDSRQLRTAGALEAIVLKADGWPD